MSRIHLLALSLLVMPVAGCMDSASDRNDRDRGRYDERDRRTNDRGGGYNRDNSNRGNSGQNWSFSERDLVRIGSVVANNRNEQNDLLEVTGKQQFRGLLFSVDRGEVSIDHIRVTFEDDTAIEPQTATQFRDGEQSRLIELDGSNRDVKRVRIKYRSHTSGPSTITVWGLPASQRGR